MTVSFTQIPTSNRVPAAYVEIDPTRAVSVQPGAQHRVLMIGLMLGAAAATPNTIVEVTGESGGDALFGTASQLALMVRAFKRVNTTARLFCCPVSENAAGTAATSTIALTGTSTAEGPLTTRHGDVRVTSSVAIGTAAAAAATAHAAAINAEPRSPVTANAASGTITLTARHKGEGGNDVTVETEKAPAGLTAVDTQPVNGATNPSLATPIAAFDDSQYDTVVSGIADATNVGLLEQELERRWGPLVKRPGHLIVARRGSHGALVSYGNARNSPRSTVMGTGLSPTPPSIWAAQVAARDAQRCDTQPNQPRNGLTLPDVEAPKPGDRFDGQERNALLYDGISTYKVSDAGQVMVERLITTYQTNTAGSPDVTYLSIETIRNLADLYRLFLDLGARHDADLVAPDGTNVDPGVPVVTPKMLRGEIVSAYRQRERMGRVKESALFAADLVVELDAVDKERINVHSVPRLLNGLVTQAHKLSFQL